jgi:exopolysaccharide biosynthesis protein
MITDTAEDEDCENNCVTLSLADFAARNSATIGIHGTYFCPKDYTSCSGKTGTFDGPVWNDRLGVMLNEFDLPYNAGAMLVSDDAGNLSYGHRAKDFGMSVTAIESNIGGSLSAGIANYPSLIEAGTNVVATETLSTSQQSNSSRGGIGFDDEYVYLVIAHSASVTDLASIFEAIGADYAMNLDGGATSALLFEHSYVYGPNRTLPNAIVFQHR